MPKPSPFRASIAVFLIATAVNSQAPPAERPVETLQFGVEWRFVRAGTAKLVRTPKSSGWESSLHLESAGLVSRLFKVNDNYSVDYDGTFCASGSRMMAEEGSRRRETNVTFSRDEKKSRYVERDLVRNSVVLDKILDIPPCVHDVITALVRLRTLKLQPGQSVQLPISDGKRLVTAKVEAQEKEKVTTPAGSFNAIRYEAHLFNDVLYQRKGRLFIWLSDDEKQTLVQVRVRLNLAVGTINLQLEKIGA